MRNYFDGDALSVVRNALAEVKRSEDKKMLYIMMGVSLVLLIIGLGIAVWLIKSKLEEDYDGDWDEEEWDEDFEDCGCDDECCCSESDVDGNVKVDQI